MNSELISRRMVSVRVAKARGAKKAVKRPPPSGIAAPPPEASMPSRSTGNSAVSHGRFRWQVGRPRSQWSCSHPDPMLRIICRFAQDKRPSVTRGSHSARSRRRGQPRSHSGQASSRGPSRRRHASSPTSRPCRRTCKSWEWFWTSPETRAHTSKSSKWVRVWHLPKRSTPKLSTAADQEGGGLQRLGGHAQVQRIQRTRHEHAGVTIAAHDTRVREDQMALPGESWSWQRHAKGTPPSTLWSFPNCTRSHRGGRRSPRRGQNWRIRTATRDVVPDPQDPRIWSEGQWPRSGVGLAAARTARPRRPTRRPSVTRRTLAGQRLKSRTSSPAGLSGGWSSRASHRTWFCSVFGASSGADRRARLGVQLLRHSPRGGGGRLQLFDQRDVLAVCWWRRAGWRRRRLSSFSPGVGVCAQALAH